ILDREREITLQAYAHQDTPLEAIVSALGVERSLVRTPIFQVMFVLQNTPTSDFGFDDLADAPIPVEAPVAAFDLTLECVERDGVIDVNLVYNADLFDRPMIERLGSHYQRLLAEVATRPTTPVASFDLLDPAERAWLIHGLNATARPYDFV